MSKSKYTKSGLTKATKRAGKSPTSGLRDWEPKNGKVFRDTKTGDRQFQTPAKKFP
jgi:hypothetical protein